MAIFFTSDTHFGHGNVIRYASRPFADADTMDAEIIRRWNSVVDPDDTVYHLGDFAFGHQGRSPEGINSLLERLNGTVYLVRGNHDRRDIVSQAAFAGVSERMEIQIEGQHITLSHYAMMVWNRSHYGAWCLYGHSHGSLPESEGCLAMDIGVDAHDYTPVSLEQVREVMAGRSLQSVDHH